MGKDGEARAPKEALAEDNLQEITQPSDVGDLACNPSTQEAELGGFQVQD